MTEDDIETLFPKDYKRHSGRTFLYLSYACAAQGIRMENTEEEIVSDRWRDLAVG